MLVTIMYVIIDSYLYLYLIILPEYSGNITVPA